MPYPACKPIFKVWNSLLVSSGNIILTGSLESFLSTVDCGRVHYVYVLHKFAIVGIKDIKFLNSKTLNYYYCHHIIASKEERFERDRSTKIHQSLKSDNSYLKC